jgi:hypothetical protein
MNIRSLAPLASLAMAAALVSPPGIASSAEQTLRAAPAPVLLDGGVAARSGAVSLREVGKQVARGVFEVDPKRLAGRRLVVTRDDAVDLVIKICIGEWSASGACNGFYIEIRTA